MKKPKRGRPRKPFGKSKREYIEVRVEAAEKEGFRKAADLAGLPLSGWIRTRLRNYAKAELDQHGVSVPFLLDNEAD